MRTQDVLALAEQSRAYHQSNVSLVFLVDFAKRVAAAECERICSAIKAEPAQEPVAWYQKRGQEVLTSHPACWGREDEPWTPLYTAPPQRKEKG